MEELEGLSSFAKLMGAGSAVNALLLMAVIWFIRRLIVKVDNSMPKIDILEVQVNYIVHELKDLGKLRERVAVLETLLSRKE